MDEIITDLSIFDREPVMRGSKYDHLMDGVARRLDCRDYDNTSVVTFQRTLLARASVLGLQGQSKVLDQWHLAFRTLGEGE